MKSTKAFSLGKSISVAAGIMALSNLLSRLLGFLRIIVLAKFGGTSSQVDAYAFSFLIPDFINHLLAGSALSITFIPIFQKYLIKQEREKAWYVFSNVMTIGSIGFFAATFISIFFTKEIISLFGRNINDPDNPQQLILTVRLTRIILPAQIFFFWGALLNGSQYAHKRFLLPALTPIIYNAGIIACGILLYPTIGIEGFSWGVLIGAFIGNVLVQIPGALRVGVRYKPVFNIYDQDFRRYVIITLPFILGMGMTFSNEFLLKIFGSFSPDGAGVLASLDYAYKIMFFLVGIFGQGIAAGSYPFLSQLVIQQKFEEIGRLTTSIITKIGTLLIPFSCIMMILSGDIVTILLQRGKFDAVSTNSTASAFTAYLPGAFFYAGVLVINRIFYAMENTLLPLIVSTSVIFSSLPLYYMLGIRYGASGIAASATLAMFILFILMYGIYVKRHRTNQLTILAKNLLIIIISTLPGMLLGYLFKSWTSEKLLHINNHFFKSAITTFSVGTPSIILTYIILEAAGIFNLRKTIYKLTHIRQG